MAYLPRELLPPGSSFDFNGLARLELSAEVSNQLVKIAQLLPDLKGWFVARVSGKSGSRFWVALCPCTVKKGISERRSRLVNARGMGLHLEPER
jgi:hypothetical protein